MPDNDSPLMKIIRERYSCHNYQARPVDRDMILSCCEAARLAPSACNSQPWRFIIIDNSALRKRICDEIFKGHWGAINSFARKAPVLVVVVSEKGNFMARVGNLVRDTRYYLMDVAIAVDHFVLRAAELGLGTCWIGWFGEKVLKKILGLSGSVRLDLVLTLGYPADQPGEKKRKSLESMVSFNDRT